MDEWFYQGTIPTVEEGIVKATACVSVQGKCCTTQIPILVKNCSDFTVYHLQPTPACPSAYCAGYEVTCPAGLASDTGYTPCHCNIYHAVLLSTLHLID